MDALPRNTKTKFIYEGIDGVEYQTNNFLLRLQQVNATLIDIRHQFNDGLLSVMVLYSHHEYVK